MLEYCTQLAFPLRTSKCNGKQIKNWYIPELKEIKETLQLFSD